MLLKYLRYPDVFLLLSPTYFNRHLTMVQNYEVFSTNTLHEGLKMMRFGMIILLYFVSGASLQHLEASPFPEDSQYSMNINMPDVRPTVPDAYLCTARKLDPHEAYIVKYDPDISVKTAHHMLLFGCKDIINQNHLYPTYWDCAHGDLCSRMTIMYGWAKNAPPMELPKDVGFLIGGNSSIHYVVLQIHYANPLPEGVTDNSGLKLHLTTQRQKYITGIRLLLADSARIPPRKPKYHVDVNCKFEEAYDIHPFAYRVHTHKLGVVVTGYYLHPLNNSWTMLAKGNPQWPQAFYPMQRKHTITHGDILAARCTYNSSDMNYAVKIGSSSNDEMCNLYVMYYTEYRNAEAGQSPPIGKTICKLWGPFPIGKRCPPFPQSSGTTVYQEAHNWPSKNLKLGQVAAVTVDHDENVVIFHRGNHIWNDLTFDDYHNYLLAKEGPIKVPTVMILEASTGLLLHQWGNDLFYMPHGLFIYTDGSFWVTDVALHQVFHFTANDLKKPALTLGEKFIPGNDNGHFCKPASVAVSKTGDIYVADGYCNSRIIRFSADGKFLNQWGKQDNVFERNPPVGSFRIPHKVVLLEDRDLTCVADRENGRIQCFTMESGRFRFQIQREEFGGTLYSITYAQEKGLLLAVCGESLDKRHMVRAFVFNVTDQRLLNVFAPNSNSGTFTRPPKLLFKNRKAYVLNGPNVVWRFLRVYHKSTKKVSDVPGVEAHEVISPKKTIKGHVFPITQENSEDSKKTDEDSSRFQTSIIIMCLLAIPILCLVLITVFLRLKRRGKFQQSYFWGKFGKGFGGFKGPPHPQDKFNLGSLLNPHKGFDRVSLEESDADGDDGSESDIEEYSAIARKT
ncbi:peptidyl-glycine alpha-amidating monooxygenase B [Trichonephila inaurata madagascariensis]|uniref:Peptidyl-glycine alpha-amidating monooxygenase B n=1 Tax=Trichonephila inaurata madagascariensis TaxID=2747483 RepID=A0A8X6XTP9_9ARAC|nr:peptidyl-glycine alpha-amidating monooxygenase B [Trichonephila inaurata madagascariensis]